jgi:RNA polymerase sigma-70 factor (ECF subfamily)
MTPALGEDQVCAARRRVGGSMWIRAREASLPHPRIFRFCRHAGAGRAFIMAMVSGTEAIWSPTDMIENEPASELLRRAGHDPDAFVQLYRRYYDGVFRYCVHRLFERHTAEDVAAEVFLRAARYICRFRGCREQQFRCWLYRVATNEVNNHLRKMARRAKLLQRLGPGPGPEENTPPSADGDAELLGRLKEAVLGLRPRYQTVITLRFFEGLGPSEIAKVIGCNPGTARSQLARAIAQMRKKLKTAGVPLSGGGTSHE